MRFDSPIQSAGEFDTFFVEDVDKTVQDLKMERWREHPAALLPLFSCL